MRRWLRALYPRIGHRKGAVRHDAAPRTTHEAAEGLIRAVEEALGHDLKGEVRERLASEAAGRGLDLRAGDAPGGGGGEGRTAWRDMAEAPADRPVTARKRLEDGSWWYARIRARDDDAGRGSESGGRYAMLHYNGDTTIYSFRGPFDGWREIEDDLSTSAESGDLIRELRSEVDRLKREADGDFVQAATRIMQASPGFNWRDYYWEGISADEFEEFFTEDMHEAWTQVERQRERADRAEAEITGMKRRYEAEKRRHGEPGVGGGR